jgi:hypothetical protein
MGRSNDTGASLGDPWPRLPLAEWRGTRDTLHMWSQVVGKVKLALCPPMNHWWQVPLLVTPRGLTTGPIPYGDRAFEMTFDLVDHELVIHTSEGRLKALPLLPRSVATFYDEVMLALRALDVEVRIWRQPVEVPDPIPFDEDKLHAEYDAAYANRFWRVLLQADAALRAFAGEFQGKASPVHFFWGSFDLAYTRFSGRPAPERPGADRITKEAYSHEVMSFGFWPGGGVVDDAAFYAYAVPEPAGYREARVMPGAATYVDELHEFILPYEDVRASGSPRDALLAFFRSTYDAGASRGGWDRAALDRFPGREEEPAPGAAWHAPEEPSDHPPP